jgi:hypothetical protein
VVQGVSGFDTLGGYNADPSNGDEVNGGGTNWRISPVLTDTSETLEPLIVTQDMLAAFGTECADIVVACEPDTVTVRSEPDTVVVARSA